MTARTPKTIMLNLGCGMSRIPFAGIKEIRMDADAAVKPDIVGDARKLGDMPAGRYDGVWCSHLLEHFYEHEVPVVLNGIGHVLKKTGVLFLFVPDVVAMMVEMSRRGLGVNDVIYQSPMGPVRPRDMLYGFQPQVASGNAFYAHKTGFDCKTLVDTVAAAGFAKVYALSRNLQVEIVATKSDMPKWATKYVQVK